MLTGMSFSNRMLIIAMCLMMIAIALNINERLNGTI